MSLPIKYNILLAEDEDNLREIISFNLKQQGYEVFAAKNGQEALDLFIENKNHLHLALLDVSMPKMNGFELCEKIKSIDKNFPVFFLTVRNERNDRVYGLKLGADDYLTKPFDLEELLLRVKRILKKYETDNIIIINDRKIDFSSMTITLPNNTQHRMSAKEALLLQYLIANKNTVLSRQQILETVWADRAEEGSYRTIDNFIVTFRKLFEEDSKNPKFFLSVRGIGYLLNLKNEQ